VFVESNRITGHPISIRSDDVIAVLQEPDNNTVSVMLKSTGEWIVLRDEFESFKRRLSQAFTVLP